MKFFNVSFGPGVTIYKNGIGPVWICPHSGPALEVPTSRDDNSDTVASLCWLKTGGTFVISNISRKQMYGVDFNRDIPPKDTALYLWPDFVSDTHSSRLERYRDKYSWVSPDIYDYNYRMKIYNDFWDTVKRLGNVTVFVHRKFCRMKNYPSVIDIITYRGEGVNKEVVKAIVDKINNKYRRFFKSIKKNYKFNIIFEQHRIIDRIKEVFGEFSLDKVKIEYKTNIMKDLEVIKKYAEKEKIKRLEKEFNKKNFIAAIKSATKSREIPRVTVDSIFTGEPAITKKRPMFLKDHIVMEVECNSFMNYWYPKQTSDILIELLDNLVSVDMYKREGIKQMQIIKYLKIPESSDH